MNQKKTLMRGKRCAHKLDPLFVDWWIGEASTEKHQPNYNYNQYKKPLDIQKY